MLPTSQEACVSVGHAGAGGTAGSLVVVVDTEACLDHHIAVVVLVLAVFIYGGREQKIPEPKRQPGPVGREEKGWETQSFI